MEEMEKGLKSLGLTKNLLHYMRMLNILKINVEINMMNLLMQVLTHTEQMMQNRLGLTIFVILVGVRIRTQLRRVLVMSVSVMNRVVILQNQENHILIVKDVMKGIIPILNPAIMIEVTTIPKSLGMNLLMRKPLM